MAANLTCFTSYKNIREYLMQKYVRLFRLTKYYSSVLSAAPLSYSNNITTVTNNRTHFPFKPNLFSYYSTTHPQYVSNALLEELNIIVGQDNVSTSEGVRNQFSRDESYHTPAKPDIVVFPTNTNQVRILHANSAVIWKLCHNLFQNKDLLCLSKF